MRGNETVNKMKEEDTSLERIENIYDKEEQRFEEENKWFSNNGILRLGDENEMAWTEMVSN